MSAARLLFATAFLLISSTSVFGGVDTFIGEWKGSGRSLTSMTIGVFHDQIKVHPFGNCSPVPCDWGEVTAQPFAQTVEANVQQTADVLMAEFLPGFCRTLLFVYSIGPDEIRVEGFTVFTDNSGRSPYHFVANMKRRTN